MHDKHNSAAILCVYCTDDVTYPREKAITSTELMWVTLIGVSIVFSTFQLMSVVNDSVEFQLTKIMEARIDNKEPPVLTWWCWIMKKYSENENECIKHVKLLMLSWCFVHWRRSSEYMVGLFSNAVRSFEEGMMLRLGRRREIGWFAPYLISCLLITCWKQKQV